MTEAATPWRCFLAVPLPDGLRAALAASVESLRGDMDAGAGWRWADPASWHVTLAFLGSTPPEAIPTLLARMREAVGNLAPFSVATGGLGAFPRGRLARVLWYGVNDHDGQLRDLAHRVQSAAGLDDANRFHPHITLARARDRAGSAVGEWLARPVPGGTVPVADVTLFRSHMGRGPSRYEALGSARLGRAVVASAGANT